MAKKNKVIYLEAPHKYNFGSFMNNITGNIQDGKFTSGMFKGMNADTGSAISAGASMLGGLAGSAISGSLESGAGNVISGLSSVASAIPGPWGAIAGAGLNVVGGLVNAAFGTKEDKEKHQRLNQATDYLQGFNSNASTFDEVTGPQAVSLDSSVYKGGWFSKDKARERNRELARQAQEALDKANRDVVNNVTTLTKNQMNDLEGSYFAFGGPLHTHGADWTNGITIIDNGGSHESNPFEGVPMGIAPDGQPNLVEEGEVIFNDYVFSNRLRVPKAVREKYKLRGQKEMTFADAAKKAQKESEERPNDPISQRGLEDIMYRLMTEQEAVRESRQQRKYSEGGKIHIAPSKKGTFTAAASKHGMGVQEFASKVLANPEDYSPAMRKKANFARNASKWKHAYGGHLFWDGGFGGDNPFNLPKLTAPTITPYINWSDPVSRAKALAEVNSLQIELPQTTLGNPRFTMGQGLLQTPKLQIPAVETDSEEGTTYKEPKTSPLASLRYLPAVGSAINAFTDLMGWTNKPDYSSADAIVQAANNIGDVRFNPIGNYLRYTPLDRLFYANQLAADAAGARRAIVNNSGGNRGTAIAGILASDYNAQKSLGDLYRQAEEYNSTQRERVATFNRATNMFNSEHDLKAQIANRENAKLKVEAAAKAAALRDTIDSRVSAAKSANLTNFLDSLGNIGREAVMESWINKNPGLRYNISLGGKGVTYGASNANGGFLTIAKKKRRK